MQAAVAEPHVREIRPPSWWRLTNGHTVHLGVRGERGARDRQQWRAATGVMYSRIGKAVLTPRSPRPSCCSSASDRWRTLVCCQNRPARHACLDRPTPPRSSLSRATVRDQGWATDSRRLGESINWCRAPDPGKVTGVMPPACVGAERAARSDGTPHVAGDARRRRQPGRQPGGFGVLAPVSPPVPS